MTCLFPEHLLQFLGGKPHSQNGLMVLPPDFSSEMNNNIIIMFIDF